MDGPHSTESDPAAHAIDSMGARIGEIRSLLERAATLLAEDGTDPADRRGQFHDMADEAYLAATGDTRPILALHPVHAVAFGMASADHWQLTMVHPR